MDLLFFLFFFTILGFVFQIAAHEIGHFLVGIITGWRFIALQVFHIAIIKCKEGSFRIKKLSSYGCQCIMYPRDVRQSATLYTLGGIIMNLIAALVFLLVMTRASIGNLSWIASFCFFGAGISMILLNGVPNTRAICNDMACFLFLRDKTTQLYHNIQLMMARGLSQGLSYCDCMPSVFMSNTICDNDILAYQAVLEFYCYIETDKYQRAKEALNRINFSKHISSGVQKIISLEILYYDLLMDILKNDFSRERNALDISRHINDHGTKGDIHTARVKALGEAYQFWRQGDVEEGIQSLDKAIAGIREMRCLYSGEKMFCIDQLYGIRNTLFRDKQKEFYS